MMYLDDARDFVAAVVAVLGIDNEHVYSGKLPNKPEKCIGVYNQKRGMVKRVFIENVASYRVKAISLLVHWNRSLRETERVGAAVYEAIKNAAKMDINEKRIMFTKMRMEEPVDVGTDDTGVFEMVIEFEIFYERQDKE